MKFTIGTATVLVLAALVSTGSARPEGSAETSTSTSTSTSTIANGEDVGTTTAVPEESKMSKFFDDVSSAFKSGTAKVKESFESAATSVKDGVLRGYGFVKDKLTGTADPTAAPGNETEASSTAATTSTVAAAVTPTTKLVSARSITGNSATAKAIGVEPNDEETKDEDRLIFIGDEDTATDAVVPTTTVAAAGASSTVKTKLDDRWIIDGPTACKSGQAVVNGKCKNVF